jgi:hypothetical protein
MWFSLLPNFRPHPSRSVQFVPKSLLQAISTISLIRTEGQVDFSAIDFLRGSKPSYISLSSADAKTRARLVPAPLSISQKSILTESIGKRSLEHFHVRKCASK